MVAKYFCPSYEREFRRKALTHLSYRNQRELIAMVSLTRLVLPGGIFFRVISFRV